MNILFIRAIHFKADLVFMVPVFQEIVPVIRTLQYVIAFVGLILPLQGAQSEFQQQLERKMPGLLSKYKVPGAEIACISKGEVVWSRAYGILNLQTHEPMRLGLIYNYGSCGKVLTAWGIMRLVEQGKIDLDGPANRYLKRYQIQSSQFDPNGVTIRRLLSHTAGLTVHGFNDYSQGERLPSLVEMLNGGNQSDGKVYIKWQPGEEFHYSGGGFVILQMVIEDVTGEPFADFMKREVTNPLGMTSLQWTWTPELIRHAAIPYHANNQPVGYRQLACQAVGSELATVNDFARFVAAVVQGPKGEPVGRNVLRPETVHQMLQAQSNTKGTAGLGYGLGSIHGEPLATHGGLNWGWSAIFCVNLLRQEGLVVAANSTNGVSLCNALQMLWVQTVFARSKIGRIAACLSTLSGISLVASILWFRLQIKSRKRMKSHFKLRRAFLVLPWVILSLLWGLYFYTTLLLPFSFPDIWPPYVHVVMALFLAWIVFSAIVMSWPKLDLKSGRSH